MALDLVYTRGEDERPPEQALWRAVVAAAVRDSRNRQSEGHVDAVVWLTSPDNRDRSLVCDLADVDEEALVAWARERYWDYI